MPFSSQSHRQPAVLSVIVCSVQRDVFLSWVMVMLKGRTDSTRAWPRDEREEVRSKQKRSNERLFILTRTHRMHIVSCARTASTSKTLPSAWRRCFHKVPTVSPSLQHGICRHVRSNRKQAAHFILLLWSLQPTEQSTRGSRLSRWKSVEFHFQVISCVVG